MRSGTLALLMLTGATVLTAGGCIGITDVFNPEFVQSVQGSPVASLPGDAPAVLVSVENRTGFVVNADVSFRGADSQVQTYTNTIQSGVTTARALFCPVTELTLGDVSDLDGARIILGNGNPLVDPFLEVEAFGVLLKENANFECGDEVTFSIIPSGDSLSGYQVYAFIQRAVQP